MNVKTIIVCALVLLVGVVCALAINGAFAQKPEPEATAVPLLLPETGGILEAEMPWLPMIAR